MAVETERVSRDEPQDLKDDAGRPPALPLERRFVRAFEHAESMLIHIVSFFLVLLVLVAMVGAVISVREPLFHDHDFTTAALDGVNSTFLAVILLELLHTTLSRGGLSRQVQEFLVIGVTAGVRHGLELAIESPHADARDLVISLAINALAVLGLVISLWLIREQLLRSGEPIEAEEY